MHRSNYLYVKLRCGALHRPDMISDMLHPTDLQSPKRRPGYRYPGLNNGDSPGEVEASQDIFWDPTSPTRANGGK